MCSWCIVVIIRLNSYGYGAISFPKHSLRSSHIFDVVLDLLSTEYTSEPHTITLYPFQFINSFEFSPGMLIISSTKAPYFCKQSVRHLSLLVTIPANVELVLSYENSPYVWSEGSPSVIVQTKTKVECSDFRFYCDIP